VDHPTEADLAAMRVERSRLRQHLHHHPADREARAALAANHRAAGHADQAGRWGLLVPGASTSAERQAFARWAVRTGATDRGRLLKILFVPRRRWLTELDSTGEVVEFEHLVEREGRRLMRGTTTVADDAFGTLMLAVPTALAGVLVGVDASVVAAFFGGPSDELGQPPWVPTTWAELWVGVGMGTLCAYGAVIVIRLIVLAVRLPSTRRARRWFAERIRRDEGHTGTS
jgi:hypothetical protein